LLSFTASDRGLPTGRAVITASAGVYLERRDVPRAWGLVQKATACTSSVGSCFINQFSTLEVQTVAFYIYSYAGGTSLHWRLGGTTLRWWYRRHWPLLKWHNFKTKCM